MIKTNASLIIVPHWLLVAIRSAHRPLATALDVVALSKMLSKKDLQLYYAIQLALWEKLPAGLRDTFQCADITEASNRWVLTDENGQQPTPSVVATIKDDIRRAVYSTDIITEHIPLLHFAFPNAGDLSSVLPHLRTHDSDVDALSLEYVFDVFYLTENVYGVSFQRRLKTSTHSAQLLESYDNLLALLNSTHSFDKVAGTAAFQAYTVLARSVV